MKNWKFWLAFNIFSALLNFTIWITGISTMPLVSFACVILSTFVSIWIWVSRPRARKI